MTFSRVMGSTTDYTSAVLTLIAVGVALTAMVVYVVTRPTDLGRK